MDDVLHSMLGLGYASGIYVAVMLGALVWFAAAVMVPRQLVLVVVLVTAAFPHGSSSGQAGAFAFDAYGKGAGYFYFSVLEITIALLAAGAALRRAGGGTPLGKYYWMMFVVLLWHVMLTLIEDERSWLTNLSRAGLLYLFLQGLLVYSLASYVESKEDLRKLMLVLALTIGVRMLWGGFRYVFLGGDPNNAYDDLTGFSGHLKMTFWDINDSIYACLLGSLLLWIGIMAGDRPRWQRVAALVYGMFCFAIVALSARRTAQGGAIMALAVLLFLLPRGRRWPVLLVVALAAPLAVYKLDARMGTGGSFLERLTQPREQSRFYFDSRYERFYELRTAWQTIKENPVLGVGPAGEFEVRDDTGLAYHQGNYGFVHSGFVHVLLKAGAIGLLIFCGLLLAYARALARAWSALQGRVAYRGVLASSACAFAASVPNLAVGTPQIESRTMLVMGVVMALPLLVTRVHARAHAAQLGAVASPHALGVAATAG